MMTKEDLYKTIGRNIREIRKKGNIKQEHLSERIGLARSSITQIENGTQAVTVYHLYLIARELNTEVHKLLPLQERMDNIFDELSNNRIDNRNKGTLIRLLDDIKE